MANNYLQFSEVVSHLTKKERWWILSVLHDYNLDPDTEDPAEPNEEWNKLSLEDKTLNRNLYTEGVVQIDWEIHQPGPGDDGRGVLLWLYSEESANLEHAAEFMQAFIKKFRPKGVFIINWACWCDKLREGEFTGGAVVITAEWIEFIAAGPRAEDLAEKYLKRKKRWPKSPAPLEKLQ